MRIVIATVRSWNLFNARKFKNDNQDQYEIVIINNRYELTLEKLSVINPDYIFFPHWCWFIPKNVYVSYRCIVFHMTDLPYGRGGSPLQNLIVNKVYDTKISAIHVVKELDAGSIYLKEPFYVGDGCAEELLAKSSDIIFSKMIPKIIKNKIKPTPQVGIPVGFKRRTPEQSELTPEVIKNERDFYDYVRMLDGEGYPRAFIKLGNLKIRFSNISAEQSQTKGLFELVVEEK